MFIKYLLRNAATGEWVKKLTWSTMGTKLTVQYTKDYTEALMFEEAEVKENLAHPQFRGMEAYRVCCTRPDYMGTTL